MKNSILKISLLVLGLIFTGCSANNTIADNKIENGILSSAIYGEIVSIENGEMLINNKSTEVLPGEVRVPISAETNIFDLKNLVPDNATSLKVGMNVFVYINEAVGMSLPPFANAKIVLFNYDSLQDIPLYATIKNIDDEEEYTSITINETNKTYKVNEDTIVKPYVKKIILSIQDLVVDSNVLIFDPNNEYIERMILLD